MTMQIRPGGNGPALSPSRDLAYCFVEITAAGATLLTTEQLREEDYELVKHIPDGLSAVQDCLVALGTAISKFSGPERADTVLAALESTGYLRTDLYARFLVEAAIGRALLSFGCHALRSATFAGFLPPEECKLQTAMLASQMVQEPAAFKLFMDTVAAAQYELRVRQLEQENERLRQAIQYDQKKLNAATDKTS
jgi:hypothetical protein